MLTKTPVTRKRIIHPNEISFQNTCKPIQSKLYVQDYTGFSTVSRTSGHVKYCLSSRTYFQIDSTVVNSSINHNVISIWNEDIEYEHSVNKLIRNWISTSLFWGCIIHPIPAQLHSHFLFEQLVLPRPAYWVCLVRCPILFSWEWRYAIPDCWNQNTNWCSRV